VNPTPSSLSSKDDGTDSYGDGSNSSKEGRLISFMSKEDNAGIGGRDVCTPAKTKGKKSKLHFPILPLATDERFCRG